MSVEIGPIGANGAKIWRDNQYPWKVYGAVGDGIREWHLRAGLPADDTTAVPTEFVVTQTGTSPLTVGQVSGYPLLLTTGATEYNGANVQLRGEYCKLAAGDESFLRGKIKLSEATNIDFLFGLCELKTDILATDTAHGIAAANVEGAFFVKLDGGTAILFKTYKNGVEASSVSVGTLTTNDIDYAIWWDGTYVHAYIDNVEVAKVAGTLPDGELTPTLNVRAGDANARTASIAELAFVSVE